MNIPRGNLKPLLDALRDDQLSSDQSKQLRHLLATDDAALRMYQEHALLVARLHWAHNAVDNSEATESPEPAPRVTALLPMRFRLSMPSLVGWAACLLLVGYFAAMASLLIWDRDRVHIASSEGGTDNTSRFATLVSATNAEWQKPHAAELPEAHRHLVVQQGRAELKFADGTQVIVEGPAEFDVLAANRGSLKRGRLCATVPPKAIGFTIETPSATVVDLGTQFAVAVDESGVDVHVIQGRVKVKPAGQSVATLGKPQDVFLAASDSARFGDQLRTHTRKGVADFTSLRTASVLQKAASSAGRQRFVLLGNLFDDPRGISLDDAMRSDTLAAVSEAEDLGVKTVIYGGSGVQRIAPGIDFDLHALGWQDAHAYRSTNDAFSDTQPVPLQSRGTLLADTGPVKFEEGLGMHANSLITFDLDEIRAAGGFENGSLEFICDRAGISDHVFGNRESSVHLAVLISKSDGVLAAVVDGTAAEVDEQQRIWSITSPVGEAVTANGRFVNFRVAIPVEAKWLTLVTTSAGDRHAMDGVVWSGARLKAPPSAATGKTATKRID